MSKVANVWLFAVAAILVATGTIAATLHAGVVVAVFVALIPVTLWLLCRRNFNSSFVSPTTIAGGIFAATAIFGYVLRGILADAQGRGASIIVALSEEQSFATFRLICLFASVIIATSGLILRLRRPEQSVRLLKLTWKAKEPSGLVVTAAAIPFLLLFIGNGPANLWERSYYLFSDGGTLLGGIGGPLATAAVLVVGYIYGATRGTKRLLAAVLLVAYVLLLLSLGSRRFALVPILFALGVFIAGNSKMARRGVILGAVLSFLLLPLPLEFRNLQTHGLASYTNLFFTLSPFQADWAGALNNVLVSFGIIGMTVFTGSTFNSSDLLMAANPLPGSVVGWYDSLDRYFLNPFTPVAGIGELGNVGWVAVVIFGIGIGMVLAWAELAVRRQVAAGTYAYAALLIGLVALFSIQMIQYTLRSALRILLYLVVLELARRAFLVMTTTKSSKPLSVRGIPTRKLKTGISD